MKKIIALIMAATVSISTTVMANNITHTISTRNHATQAESNTYSWSIENANDAIRIENTNGTQKIFIKNEQGNKITANCGGVVRDITRGNGIICALYEGASLSIYILKENYTVGATGIYTLLN